MKRNELLAAIETARAIVDSALDGLTADELTIPGQVGDWSIKDLLAHVTAWDVDLLTNIGKFERGQKPGRTSWDLASTEEQNQAWTAEFKERPLERVLADYDGVHEQLRRQVQSLTDAELEAPAAWLQGRSLSQYFLDHVVTHENDHGAELVEWRRHRP